MLYAIKRVQQTKENDMNTKKTIASLVGVLLIATVLVMAVNAAGMDRSKYADMPRMAYEFDANNTTGLYINYNDILRMPNVRIYGEEGAIYPTQSYTGADDFIYPDPVDPFDPGVIGKDSVTFNPAYIDNQYANARDGRASTITVDDENSDEKVFLRLFYEPGYYHVADDIMSDYYSLTPVSMENGAIVTETTYMLLNDNSDNGHAGEPKLGSAGYDRDTHFMLPVTSLSPMDDNPGMDVADMVDLVYAEAGSIVTAGTIEVELDFTGTNSRLGLWDNATFMDHSINVTSFEDGGDGENDSVILDVSYLGNMYLYEPKTDDVTMEPGDKLYFNRNNDDDENTNPEYRWYIEVEDVVYDGAGQNPDFVKLTLGRRLVAGETFYVDGVRYDMPAIYVAEEDGEDKFKYITFQSPIPKCPTLWDTSSSLHPGRDWSHVTSQWLANLDENMTVWVLPPFSETHTMIDDIGLAKFDANASTYPPDWEICTWAGDIISGTKGALEFYYVDEDIEERFDTSLAERHARKDGVESWNWWSVFTKPDHYTELYLPDQETTSDSYVDNDCEPVDGNEYLITTSFIAPNSEGPERDLLSKSTVDVHDIIDRAATLNGTGSAAPTCGDVNGDDKVNTLDVTTLFDHVTAGLPYEAVADVNNDGNVNTLDVTRLFDFVTNGTPSLSCP